MNPSVSSSESVTQALTVTGVDFVQYYVHDLEAAVLFYHEVLGLRLEIYSEEWEWAELNCGNVTLALKGGAAVGSTPTCPHLVLAVPDVYAAYAALVAQGVSINTPPADYGVCRHFEFFDPDGNIVALHQRVAKPPSREPVQKTSPR